MPDPGAIIEAAKAADGLGVPGAIAATAILVSAVWLLVLWRVWGAWREDDQSKDDLLASFEKALREDTAARSQRSQSWVTVAQFVESVNRTMISIELRLAQIEARLTQIEGRLR